MEKRPGDKVASFSASATSANGVTVIWASRVLGIPIPKTLVIWVSPVALTLTLTQIAKVISEGDVLITRVLGMGMPKTRGCPYHTL